MEDTVLSSSSSPSSSSASSRWKYDVFLSFCGKDTRNNFTDHLYTSLKRNGINTFRDDQNLEKGEDFPPRLLSAIKQSWCSIIIFSKGYAFSRWCLDELAEIVNQKKKRAYQVYPIFYDVDPSELRSQKQIVAEAFAKHEDRYKENKGKTQTWRDALFEVANISGWDFKKDGSEAKLIRDVVKGISAKLFRKRSRVPDDLIVCKLEENLDALRTEVAELKELRTVVLRRVKMAEDQRQLKRLDQVQGWLLRTETVINDAQSCCGSSWEVERRTFAAGEAGERKLVNDNNNNTNNKTNVESGTSRLCRNCRKEESCVLLLPCRHLCLCKGCESSLHICPMCKATKTASVRVNMS